MPPDVERKNIGAEIVIGLRGTLKPKVVIRESGAKHALSSLHARNVTAKGDRVKRALVKNPTVANSFQLSWKWTGAFA